MRHLWQVLLLCLVIASGRAQFPFGQGGFPFGQGGFPFGQGGFPFDMSSFMNQMQGMTSQLQGMGTRMSAMGQQISQQAARQAQLSGVNDLAPGEFRQLNNGNMRGFAYRSPDGSSSSFSFGGGTPGGGMFYTFGPDGVTQVRRF